MKYYSHARRHFNISFRFSLFLYLPECIQSCYLKFMTPPQHFASVIFIDVYVSLRNGEFCVLYEKIRTFIIDILFTCDTFFLLHKSGVSVTNLLRTMNGKFFCVIMNGTLYRYIAISYLYDKTQNSLMYTLNVNRWAEPALLVDKLFLSEFIFSGGRANQNQFSNHSTPYSIFASIISVCWKPPIQNWTQFFLALQLCTQLLRTQFWSLGFEVFFFIFVNSSVPKVLFIHLNSPLEGEDEDGYIFRLFIQAHECWADKVTGKLHLRQFFKKLLSCMQLVRQASRKNCITSHRTIFLLTPCWIKLANK